MLVIRTGKPGHGKTLNTIKEVDAQAASSSRIVYFHNINGLKPDTLEAQWYEFEDPTKWHELPHNSIVVIDEAQGWFGNTDPRSRPEEHLTAFETMRHSGFEVHLITQDPRFIHPHARRLANLHVHYWRVMKSRQLLRFSSEVVIERVDVMASFKDADKTRLRLDAKMFEKYTSSNADHHFRFQPSKKLIMSIMILVGTAFLAYTVYSRLKSRTESPDLQLDPVSSITNAAAPFVQLDKPKPDKEESKQPKKLEEMDYFEQHTPRLKNVPSSAPIYDELTAPQTYPKLTCMSSEADTFLARLNPWQIKEGVGCQCYTQQATKLDIEHDFCMQVVRFGYFDHARPDPVPTYANNMPNRSTGHAHSGTEHSQQAWPTMPNYVTQPQSQQRPAGRALY